MRWQFVLQRLIWTVFVLVGITIFTFLLGHVVPTDPARAAAGPEASAQHVENLRKELGLDRPLPVQYYDYMRGLLSLNFGRSYRSQRPVRQDLVELFPATLELALFVILVYTVISISLGVWTALNQGRISDYVVRTLAAASVALPAFWLGMLLQLTFYSHLRLFPLAGRIEPGMMPPTTVTGLYVIDSLIMMNWPALKSSIVHLVLPVTAVAMAGLGVGLKLTRVVVLEILGQDYVRTARSKGLSEFLVTYKHVLRNAAIPIVTALGLQFGSLLGGTVVAEVVFAWPGIGRYAVGSIQTFDFPAIMSVTVVIALIFLVINFFIDMLYLWLDPRIKYG
jgi:peptide/nickel transport system permease protein